MKREKDSTKEKEDILKPLKELRELFEGFKELQDMESKYYQLMKDCQTSDVKVTNN